MIIELGINFAHIRTKSLSVLNPLKRIDSHIMDDTDLAGPLFFALMMGVSLLLVCPLVTLHYYLPPFFELSLHLFFPSLLLILSLDWQNTFWIYLWNGRLGLRCYVHYIESHV